MASIPLEFPIPAESAVISYPYTDIKEGTGTVRYLGSRIQIDNNSANDKYFLTTQSGIFSAEVSGEPKTQLAASSEFNFDVMFNVKKIINGDLYAMIPLEVTGSATTVKLRILKWDGSTETQLAAQVTYQATSSSSGNYVVPVLINVDNKVINSGESLRIELVTTGGTSAYLQHDPSGSISASPTGGVLSFFVPFKIQD